MSDPEWNSKPTEPEAGALKIPNVKVASGHSSVTVSVHSLKRRIPKFSTWNK